MKGEFKGIGKVFKFTFLNQLRSKGYRVATILLAVLLFVIPAGVMIALELSGDNTSVEEALPNTVDTVYIVDNTNTVSENSFSQLNAIGAGGLSNILYVSCESADIAQDLASNESNSAILAIDNGENGMELNLLLPSGTSLDEKDLQTLASFIGNNFKTVLFSQAGIDAGRAEALMAPVGSETIVHGETATGEDDSLEAVRQIISYVLSFGFIMLLYFLVLFYGQSVANSVLLEKSSKLMDMMLISAKPSAMVFGKVFAIVLSSILQFFIWAAATIGGFAAGTFFVKQINPQTDMALVRFFDSLSGVEGVFSIPGAVLVALILMGGFLLYCSLAAIGGSAAGKQEDLSSTNSLFTLALVVSFLCALYTGGLEGGADVSPVIYYVPFTSMLVTPAKLLLGEISLTTGLISFALIVITSAIVMYIAGKIYKLMALYKGNPPKLNELFKMVFGR